MPDFSAKIIAALAANPDVDSFYMSPTDQQMFVKEKDAKEHERAITGDALQDDINALISDAKDPSVVLVEREDYLPEAEFSADVREGEAPLNVQFTDASTKSPTEWLWDFGDGSEDSIEQNPEHVYAEPGTYTVRLKATNGAGDGTETKTAYITVTEEE